jgi:hypothetical protein
LNNPYLDELIIHERHDMMDTDLPEINTYVRQFFDVHVDTTFVVENNLLVVPQNPMSQKDRVVDRRRYCNKNYLEAYKDRFNEQGLDLELGDLELS